MTLHTQLPQEKKWVKTSTKEALKLILDEMPDTDAKSTLEYIEDEVKKGKIITLGECKFCAK